MTSIVLVDDHNVLRQGLRALLEAQPEFTVVGEAATGVDAIRLAKGLKPDVLVLDLMMPGINGIEAARQVRKVSPDTKTIILSMFGNDSYIHEALRAGVRGYVLKESTSDELVTAIHKAAEGKLYLSSSLAERAIQMYSDTASAKPEETSLYDLLTIREREVLHLVVQDCTSAEIGERLCISRRTVEAHRANVMRKLGMKNKADLLRYALSQGLLPAPV